MHPLSRAELLSGDRTDAMIDPTTAFALGFGVAVIICSIAVSFDGARTSKRKTSDICVLCAKPIDGEAYVGLSGYRHITCNRPAPDPRLVEAGRVKRSTTATDSYYPTPAPADLPRMDGIAVCTYGHQGRPVILPPKRFAGGIGIGDIVCEVCGTSTFRPPNGVRTPW